MVLAAPFEGDPFWDPVDFSWPIFGILLAVTAVLTIGFLVWTVLQPDEPEDHTARLVDESTRKDREKAAAVRRRQDDDAGRSPTGTADLEGPGPGAARPGTR